MTPRPPTDDTAEAFRHALVERGFPESLAARIAEALEDEIDRIVDRRAASVLVQLLERLGGTPAAAALRSVLLGSEESRKASARKMGCSPGAIRKSEARIRECLRAPVPPPCYGRNQKRIMNLITQITNAARRVTGAEPSRPSGLARPQITATPAATGRPLTPSEIAELKITNTPVMPSPLDLRTRRHWNNVFMDLDKCRQVTGLERAKVTDELIELGNRLQLTHEQMIAGIKRNSTDTVIAEFKAQRNRLDQIIESDHGAAEDFTVWERDEILTEARVKLQAFKRGAKGVSQAAVVALAPVATADQDRALSMLEKLEHEERELAEFLGIPFAPSPKLQAAGQLIWRPMHDIMGCVGMSPADIFATVGIKLKKSPMVKELSAEENEAIAKQLAEKQEAEKAELAAAKAAAVEQRVEEWKRWAQDQAKRDCEAMGDRAQPHLRKVAAGDFSDPASIKALNDIRERELL